MGGQQRRGGVVGAAQRGAVGSSEGQIAQGLTGGQGLLHTLVGEAGEIVAALDAVFQIETAQAVANQQDPERHRHTFEQKSSYVLAFCTLEPVSR
jgi:hypothetical protein